jgi:dolichol kinase
MLVHVGALLVPFLAEATSRTGALEAVTALTMLYIPSELIRLRGGIVPIITVFTLRMSRPSERPHFVSNPVYLAFGLILALIIFPKAVAYASIAIVAVGDPIAAYVGGRIGRLRIGRKSLEGFVAGLVASVLVASLVVAPLVAAVGSTAAMLLELSGAFEDNITMPVGAGAAMLLVSGTALHIV